MFVLLALLLTLLCVFALHIPINWTGACLLVLGFTAASDGLEQRVTKVQEQLRFAQFMLAISNPLPGGDDVSVGADPAPEIGPDSTPDPAPDFHPV